MIISFTGYRLQKCGGYQLPNPTYNYVCQEIENLLKELKPEAINSGMANGVDQWAAVIAHRLQIPFNAIIPFEGQEINWPKESQQAYHLLRKLAASEVIVSSGGYSNFKFQVRNQYLVDHCDLLIAVIKPQETSGGTYNCLQYAKSVSREMITIDPSAIETQ
jgi:uncharacterized phage-like protein YoqJ